jgi:hypothetical protein
LRIYVAGPYSPVEVEGNNKIVVAARNVNRAIEIAIELIKKGHNPFVPHLNHYISIHEGCPLNVPWYKLDYSFVDHWAEGLFYIGHSYGADLELARAKKLGLKIFYSLEEVPNESK